MQHALSVDLDYFEQGGCSFDDLETAARKLLSSSEDGFNAAKEEAWYTRVFDMVTFSQKKTIRIASQVQTLAQAQSILMEVLARLSATDARAFELLASVRADIDRLAANDVRLAKRLRSLELKAHGLAEQQDLSHLTSTEKQVLAALLASLVPESGASPLQLRYARKVLFELGVEHAVAGNPAVLLEEVTDTKKKRLMLLCCLEYVFLHREELDLGELDDNFKDSFDLGNKSWIELKARVNNKHRFQGAEGFIGSCDDAEPIEDTLVTTIDQEIPEPSTPPPVEREDIAIREILHISVGETRVFENANLLLGSFINCAGTLIIRNCTLDYGESWSRGRIVLAKEARLEILHSSVTCWGLGESDEAFIKCDGNNSITIERCALNNCARFIKAESADVKIQSCHISNPWENFVASGYVLGAFDMHDCTIVFRDLATFQQESAVSHHTVFNHAGGLIRKCSFVNESALDEDSGITIAGGYEGTVRACRFEKFPKVIVYPALVEDTVFVDCQDVINIAGSAGSELQIKNCIFERCTDVISARHAVISASKFYDCGGTVVSAYDSKFELCEFVDVKPRSRARYGIFGAGISLEHSGVGSSYGQLIFKRCRFDGFDGGENSYLAGVDVGDSHSEGKMRFDECIFENCRTKRADGQLIKETVSYKSFWSENSVRVVRFSGCTGLDKVNAGEGTSSRVRQTTVGAAAAGFAFAGPLGAVAAAVAANFVDRD